MNPADSLPPGAAMADESSADSAAPEGSATAALRPAASAVAQAVHRLHRRLGGQRQHESGLAAAVRQLWHAMQGGDVCLALAALSDDSQAALAASPVVWQADAGTAEMAARPLVLSHQRLYSRRYWQAERQLAQALLDRAQAAAAAPNEPAATDYDPFAGATPGDAQRAAVQLATRSRLLILTGGPGTGKTFTLAAIVRAAVQRAKLAAQAESVPDTVTGALPVPLTIAVAAPTGKATARLAGSIGQALASAANDDASGAGLVLEAMTLHRLLRVNPGRGLSGQTDPLPFDLIVIDECSMVDALMAHNLMVRLAPTASIVLAGDRDQLASVEAGAFFSAVCLSTSPPLTASRIVLDQNYRQKEAPEIVAWAQAVCSGQLTPATLPATGQQVFFEAGGVAALIDRACARLQTLLSKSSGLQPAALRGLYDEFLACQILALLRVGPTGVEAINRAVAGRLAPGAGSTAPRWYAGRLVVVRRNATARDLYNGDIGLCVGMVGAPGATDAEPMLVVAFPDASAEHGMRLVLPSQMPVHDDAWALTVHQAQGSDFDEVLLMPAPVEHLLASREGLYTALTRARQRIRIYGEASELIDAAASPVQRQSGLLDTLNTLPS